MTQSFDYMGALVMVLLFMPPFILSLSFHEYAHAWVANRLGDSTAKYMGRLTMDPMAHISWFGTVFLPAFFLLMNGPLFGWANPVPVDMRNFKRPRVGMAIVAAAGPVSNLLLATLFAFVLSMLPQEALFQSFRSGEAIGTMGAGAEMLRLAIVLNLSLAFFNLLPLPPLDGSRIVQGFVSAKTADTLDQIAQYSFYIFLILMYLGVLRIIGIPVMLSYSFLMQLFGIPAIGP
jgi:Zn-dependent protease